MNLIDTIAKNHKRAAYLQRLIEEAQNLSATPAWAYVANGPQENREPIQFQAVHKGSRQPIYTHSKESIENLVWVLNQANAERYARAIEVLQDEIRKLVTDAMLGGAE